MPLSHAHMAMVSVSVLVPTLVLTWWFARRGRAGVAAP
jgi:hypothetical protein